MILFMESKSNTFDLNNPGRYVKDFMYFTKVGNVSGHDYQKFEKGLDSEIRYMTATEYIRSCMKDIFQKNDYAACVTNATNKTNIDKYSKDMLEGDTFPIPYLDFVHHQQEGRHRALAYEKAFGVSAKFPVLCIYPADPTNDEIMKYAIKKWGKEHSEWGYEYVASNFKTASEIDSYLGRDSEINNFDDKIEETDLDNEFISDMESSNSVDELEELSKKSGISVDKLSTMSASSFIRLLDKYL